MSQYPISTVAIHISQTASTCMAALRSACQRIMAEPVRLLAVAELFSLKLSALERQSVSGHQPCHNHSFTPVSSRKRAGERRKKEGVSHATDHNSLGLVLSQFPKGAHHESWFFWNKITECIKSSVARFARKFLSKFPRPVGHTTAAVQPRKKKVTKTISSKPCDQAFDALCILMNTRIDS